MAALRDARTAARAIGVSSAAWLAEVVVYWLLGQAFDVKLPFTDYVLVMIAANMVVSLPLTPWDVGARRGHIGDKQLHAMPRSAQTALCPKRAPSGQ